MTTKVGEGCLQNGKDLNSEWWIRLGRGTWSFCLERVPDVGVEVIVPSEEESATLAEGDTGYATDDLVVRVQCQLLVSPDVEQPARRIVRTSRKCLPTWEELQQNNQSF